MKRKLKKELLLMNMEANVIITKTSSFYNSATSNKGESYILRKGTTWTDMSMGGKKIKNTNACIKGFSRVQDETPTINVEEIRLNKTNEEILVGESFTLTATVFPENATNKEVEWESSAENIAVVSKEKIITAVSEGTATIKVTSIDGKYTATCKVTVNVKTNTADDIYKEQESGSEFIKNESGDSKDTTVSNKNIPYAGEAIRIIIGIFIGAIIVGIILKRCIDLKDIK